MSRVARVPDDERFRRASRVVTAVFGFAVLVSVVHYTDNVAGYDGYPQSDTLPNPSRWVILGAWFGFTAFGIAGLVLMRDRRVRPAVLCLAVYSGSGLVGIGHYLVPGATDMDWWRQTHVVLDIAAAVVLLGVLLWCTQTLQPGRRRSVAT
ncbi:MAG: hypothetical protein AB7G37_08870 [Solirubrobacteraceae bacterium]